MSSTTEIANLAISHLGVAKEISNLTTDTSQEARACRQFYDICLDIILRQFAWPFSRKYVALSLIEENPNDEWGFSYRYPSDCLDAVKIVSFNTSMGSFDSGGSGYLGSVRNDSRQTRVPYDVSSDNDGKIILTDMAEAQLLYVSRMTDPNLYHPDFTMALSFLLSSYIAPRLIAGDPFKLADKMFQLYQQHLSIAMAKASNEIQPDEEVESEFIRVRGINFKDRNWGGWS